MTTMFVHTVTSEDAHQAATSDRQARADLALDRALVDAVHLIRDGFFEHTPAIIEKACRSAERILGNFQVRPGATWTTNAGHELHTCGTGCEPTAVGCCWGDVRRPHTPCEDVCQWCGWIA